MTVRQAIDDLIGEVDKGRQVLARILAFHDGFASGDFQRLGRTSVTAIVFAEIYDNLYTCLETLFLRIAQFYGNPLGDKRWHMDLLDKMRLDAPDRPAVLRDETHALLMEFLKFRHFRRYYVALEYDWDKLDFLARKLERLRATIDADLDAFRNHLGLLRDAGPE